MIEFRNMLLLFFCLFALGCSDSPTSLPAHSPPTLVPNDLRITKDFGIMKPGEVSMAEIPIKNDSEQDWQFQDISISCSCVKVLQMPENVLKGQSGLLKVSLTAGQKASDVSQAVLLKYHGLPSRILVTLQSKVRQKLHISSDTVSISIESTDTSGAASVRVENWSGKAWNDITVTSDNSSLSFSKKILPLADLNPVQPLQKWDLAVVANSPKGRYGKWSETVKIQGGDQERLIRLQVERSHPVRCVPAAIVISRKRADVAPISANKASVLLTRRSSRVTPSDVKCSGINLPSSVRIECVQDGNACRIVLSIEGELSGAISGAILLQFSDGTPEISIPVLGGV